MPRNDNAGWYERTIIRRFPYRNEDGTLARGEGVVGSIYNARGGSVNLDVSGVSVFIPVSAGDIPEIKTGSSIRLIGKIQHWKGKEEIIVEDGKDINLL